MDNKPDDGWPVACRVSDSETSIFDLESQLLDFDHSIFGSSSDTDTSIYDCSLDESFQQIKKNLEQLHCASSKKSSRHRMTMAPNACSGESPVAVVDDEFPEIDIDERFDIMKNRVRNYQDQETETLRQYIIELNNTLARVTNNEGKLCIKTKGKNHVVLISCQITITFSRVTFVV